MYNLKYVSYTVLFLLPAAVPLFFYFSGNWYSFFHTYSVGMWLGIFSYICLLNTLILSARIPVLDRIFGHDRVMVFHGYMALLGILLAAGHVIFKKIHSFPENFQYGLGAAAFSIYVLVITGTLLFMVSGIIHRIGFFKVIKQKFGKTRIGDYGTLKLLHNSVSVATVLITLHVILASSTQASPVRMWITGGYGGAAIAVWVYHKFIRVFLLNKNKWTVSAVLEPSPAITQLQLKRESGRGHHKPGQFAYIRILSKETGFEEHPFTISSAPGEPLTFTIKNLGNYTSRIKNIPEGTQVLLDGPYGKFTPALTDKPLLFIAGGIGITPFMSILGQWNRTGFKGPVTLVWSCRTAKDLFCRKFLETCAAEHEQFTFIPVLTREGEKQRITKELLESLSIKPDKVYFCGPEPLRRACTEYLRGMGIRAGRTHYERFS